MIKNAKIFAKKHYKSALDSINTLKSKAKSEMKLVKLAGVKDYSRLRMNRIKKSSAYAKAKEYSGVAAGSAIIGAGIASLASQGYNKIKKNKKKEK
tara:strand:- start:503 stop:790 length:288 start_codon:yes stop_codon:yes gene_type:complete